MNFKQYSDALRASLSPDLLKKGFTGYCYIYAESLYHYAQALGLCVKVKCLRLEGLETHWWVEYQGEVYDVTPPRTPFPYSLGKGKGFLTKNPSKRAALLASRVKSFDTANP